ncbi:hypothetical protein I2F27_00800 [Acinetobacter sp. B5B]|uniref:hypothetical protein n=1 Tax=Acinetobacter baretiae TaxID=2605383 RepID=UPI0018C1F394|nr:hypothetical protein [Acinetobacter baretiae]MBF7681876.1 hypothetical protein [Acinetobacter baretiae]MBF7685750.1 hypothetical protein [Acinetobacter baretiae]
MNAPRQGLFASLLIVCFVLQTLLLVIATTHQLKENRANQGQLMTSQLITDSLPEMMPPNTVSLALIGNRYATNPSVASLRILDASQQVLATAGLEQTRSGEVFSRDIMQGERKIGQVQLTLIEPSIGEILRSEWLAMTLSLLLYVFLWLAYRLIARPTRREYLARLAHENELKQQISTLNQALSMAQSDPSNTCVPTSPEEDVEESTVEHINEKTICLNIQFYDPKQLLDTVSQSVTQAYFNLCQLFLNKTITQCAQHYNISVDDFIISNSFDAHGVTVEIDAEKYKDAECLMMICAVFQMLSDVLYRRYREEKRFVLHTRCAISSGVKDMQLDALPAAKRLTQSLTGKESAVYINHKFLQSMTQCYQLVTLPHPTNALTRHAYLINGMNHDCADLAQRIRTQILKG